MDDDQRRSRVAGRNVFTAVLTRISVRPGIHVNLPCLGGRARRRDTGGMTSTVDELVAAVGAQRIRLVPANDSKDECGSARDRHENIGKGRIGTAPFRELLAHPALAGVPVVV